jgi:hypothetical protein
MMGRAEMPRPFLFAGRGEMADEHIVAGNGRALQVARVKRGGWTKQARTRFLDTLAETCNVTMAMEAAGMRGRSAYDLRRRDAQFAALWQEALTLGYERLEQALLAHAIQAINAIEIGAARDGEETGDTGGTANKAGCDFPGSGITRMAPNDVQLALALLNRHRATVEGRRAAVRGKRRATPEETDAALRKKLDILARKLRSGA